MSGYKVILMCLKKVRIYTVHTRGGAERGMAPGLKCQGYQIHHLTNKKCRQPPEIEALGSSSEKLVLGLTESLHATHTIDKYLLFIDMKLCCSWYIHTLPQQFIYNNLKCK